tara:strand:- start:6364 stop:6564 length:201 start_codon:yes stop_codon:yes gene_type:complete
VLGEKALRGAGFGPRGSSPPLLSAPRRDEAGALRVFLQRKNCYKLICSKYAAAAAALIRGNPHDPI